jgi:hypothetical protein
MDDGQKGVMRTALEMQFRYKFYQDITFPYLQSIGIRDVFQGFGNNETGFIGMLHLWWVPEESNVHFDSPKKFPIKIKGFWKAEWFDTPEEGMKYAQEIQKNNIYDSAKLQAVMESSIKEMMEAKIKRQIMKQIQEQQEDEFEEMEIPEEILWN